MRGSQRDGDEDVHASAAGVDDPRGRLDEVADLDGRVKRTLPTYAVTQYVPLHPAAAA